MQGFLKITLGLAILLLVLSVTVMFCSEELATKIGVTEFRVQYRMALGLTVLNVATYIVLASLFLFFGRVNKVTQQLGANRQYQIRLLRNLTPEERQYILRFLADEQGQLTLPLIDQTAQSLRMKEIIRIEAEGNGLCSVPHTLLQWARQIFEQNPHLLESAPAPEESQKDHTEILTPPKQRTIPPKVKA